MPEDTWERQEAFLFVMTGEGWLALPASGGRWTGTQLNTLRRSGQSSPAQRVGSAEGEKRREKGEAVHFPASIPIRLRCTVGLYPE